MTPDQQHAFTEAIMAVRKTTPRLWWNLYQGCLETGFEQHQAFSLLHTYILSGNIFGIRPDNSAGPKTDDPDS